MTTADQLSFVELGDLTKPDLRARICGDDYGFHRARYLCETASIEDRNASGQWLIDHGVLGVYGKMILTNRKVGK